MRKIVGLWLIALSAQAASLPELQRQESIYRGQMQWAQDAAALNEIIALWSGRFGVDSVGIAKYYSRLGSALMRTGDYLGAEQALRSSVSALEAGGPLYGFAANRAKMQLARALEQEDKAAEAEQLRGSITPEVRNPKPDTNAVLIEKHGQALYTDAARKNGVSGAVSVYVEIDETGQVTAVHVLEPVGFGLDENSVDAVSKWKFKPASLNGAPVACTATAEVSFRNMN